MGSLLRQDFQGLHNELLLRLGEHYQQVFNGLSILASFASSEDPYQGPRDITSPVIMVRPGYMSHTHAVTWADRQVGRRQIFSPIYLSDLMF